MFTPKVSVILPISSHTHFLEDCLKSLVLQNYANLEIIVVIWNDNFQSLALCNLILKDLQFRIIEIAPGETLSVSLNIGIEAARADFIMRMDADDICFPQRISTQINFFLNPINAGVSVLGSAAILVDEFGARSGILKMPAFDTTIKSRLLWRNSLIHPTVMFRREVLTQFRYNPSSIKSQDYELWLRMGPSVKFANIQEPLLVYRLHKKQHSNLAMSRTDRTWINLARLSLGLHLGHSRIPLKLKQLLWSFYQSLLPMIQTSRLRRR